MGGGAPIVAVPVADPKITLLVSFGVGRLVSFLRLAPLHVCFEVLIEVVLGDFRSDSFSPRSEVIPRFF